MQTRTCIYTGLDNFNRFTRIEERFACPKYSYSWNLNLLDTCQAYEKLSKQVCIRIFLNRSVSQQYAVRPISRTKTGNEKCCAIANILSCICKDDTLRHSFCSLCTILFAFVSTHLIQRNETWLLLITFTSLECKSSPKQTSLLFKCVLFPQKYQV